MKNNNLEEKTLEDVKLEKNRLLKNGVFINETIYKLLGDMVFMPFNNYQLCNAFIKEKGNALFSNEGKFMYAVCPLKKGLAVYNYQVNNIKNGFYVFPWKSENMTDKQFKDIVELDETGEMFDSFFSVDGSPFGYFTFE